MSPSRLLIALFASLALTSLHAQDPAKVDRRHCKVEFEDSQVRILRWSVGPQEKVPVHQHSRGIVIALTEARVRFALPDGKTKDAQIKAGKVSRRAQERHAVENLSSQRIETLEIEYKPKARDQHFWTGERRLSRAELGKALADLLGSATKPQTEETPPSGGTVEDPCQPQHGKYRSSWGPDGGCGSGFGGEYVTDCMQSQMSQAGCADAQCFEDACHRCGGSWQSTGTSSSGSGECMEPADDPFPCC